MEPEPDTQTIIDGLDAIDILDVPDEPQGAESQAGGASETSIARIVLATLGAIVFVYFARPVVLPVLLAMIVATTLKPLVGWLADRRVHRSVASAIVLFMLIAALGTGFFHLGQPAVAWMNDAPQHMRDLRHRAQALAPHIKLFGQAAEAVNNLGATNEEKTAEQKQTPTVEVKQSPDPGLIIGWTGTFVVGLIETGVLIYLLLASGDIFLRKLVHVMPTLSDKKRAVEITREIQQNISNYLFTVTLINTGLGIAVSAGLFFMGVPNPLMWGVLAAVLNYVPYFGPIVGVLLLAVVGLLTFDTIWAGLFPPGWYLLLHLLEANFVAPILLGRRFTMNAVVIFVSLMFWTWLWGVPGAILSVPILVSVKAISDRFPKLSAISELMTSGEK